MTRRAPSEPVISELLVERDLAHRTVAYTMKAPDGGGEYTHTIAPNGDDWTLTFTNGATTVVTPYPTAEDAAMALLHMLTPELRPPVR